MIDIFARFKYSRDATQATICNSIWSERLGCEAK